MNHKRNYLNLFDKPNEKAENLKWVSRFFVIPISSIIIFCVTFVTMINISIPFAMACSRVPLLRDFASVLAFSPSLSAAIENEYVQLIQLEQKENDITMRVEYIIVDQKQLNIFYSLQSSKYSYIEAFPSISNMDGTPLTGQMTMSSRAANSQNGGLQLIVVEFTDNIIPNSLKLICDVSDYTGEPVQVDLFQSSEPKEPTNITTFEFILNFNPTHMHQGKIITLNQDFTLGEQHLTATTADIYPTHMRLNLEADSSNTAWLTSLNFYIENEQGKRFDTVKNGISSTGSIDSPMMKSYRLESPFFFKSDNLTLYITSAIFLNKEMERIKINLINGTAERLPEGVILEHAVHQAEGWELTFTVEEREGSQFSQVFGAYYYDEMGSEYIYHNWLIYPLNYDGELPDKPESFRLQLALSDYPYDSVYLSPLFSHNVDLNETPVIIAL